MTTLQTNRPAPPPTIGMVWLLHRYAAGGVTACLSTDLRVELTIDARGGVLADAGLLRAIGHARLSDGVPSGERLMLEQMRITGLAAAIDDSLESRILRSLRGPFTVSLGVWDRGDPLLALRRQDLLMQFAAGRPSGG